MGTYVGKWDCPLCGTKRISGWENGRTVEHCPACGGPTTGKWYLDDRFMEIGDAVEIAAAKSKRSWKCGHCGKVNDGADQDCDACGNPRDKGTDDQQFISREYAPENVPTSGDDIENPHVESVGNAPAASEVGYSVSARARMVAAELASRKRRVRILKIAGIAIGSLILFIFLLFWKREIPVLVTGFTWERTVDIEAFGPHDESSWDRPPSGAYHLTSATEVHHYNTIVVGRDCHTESHSVVCGTTDNGNGTFSDRYCDESEEVCVDRTVEEPVYATKYYYTIDRWGFDHTEKASAKDQLPHWPTFAKTKSEPNRYRESTKKENYSVKTMRKSGSEDMTEIPFAKWKALKLGQQVKGRRNAVFGFWMGLDL